MSEMMMAAAAAMANQNPQAMEQYFESLKLKQLAEAGMLANVAQSSGQKVNSLSQGYQQAQKAQTASSSSQKHSKKRMFENEVFI